MASYTASRAVHKTLTSNVVDTVTLDSDSATPSVVYYGTVEVMNRDSTNWLWFTTNGATPTVAGDNTYVVPPGGALEVTADSNPIKLLASAAVPYTVTGI